MGKDNSLLDLFRINAESVSAKVSRISTISDAFDYTTALASKNKATENIIAAPGFTDSQLDELRHKIPKASIIQTGLSSYSKGIRLSITHAEFGIAETGTLVINSREVDKRLATMIPDVHVAVLSESDIVETADDLIPELSKILSESTGYLAFVTGASRTADIERVLVVGVHGPLELHILIQKDV
ncbi:MAG: lactate utilization protein [Desulfobacteraceae bacterium]|nr:lactate utilization protein [Desulfobacteraceae bacterium]